MTRSNQHLNGVLQGTGSGAPVKTRLWRRFVDDTCSIRDSLVWVLLSKLGQRLKRLEKNGEIIGGYLTLSQTIWQPANWVKDSRDWRRMGTQAHHRRREADPISNVTYAEVKERTSDRST